MTDRDELAGWGRKNGFLETRLRRDRQGQPELTDRLLILDVVNRYGWAFDERDLEGFFPLLAPDAVVEGSVAGVKPVGPHVGRDAVMKWLRNSIARHSDQRRHVLSNPIVISQTEDTATVNVYLTLTSAENGRARLMMTGFYVFALQKNDGDWIIRRVFAGFDNPAGTQAPTAASNGDSDGQVQ